MSERVPFPDDPFTLLEHGTIEGIELIPWGSNYTFAALLSGEDGSRCYAVYERLRESHSCDLQRMALFDLLTNNADRKGGHCLLDVRGHVWGIDHGLTFHHVPKLRTVIWDYCGEP